MALRIGWFSTGRDEAAGLLLEKTRQAMKNGRIEGAIAYVFSNREPGRYPVTDQFFSLVKNLNLELISFSSDEFMPELRRSGKEDPEAMTRWRIAFDEKIWDLIRSIPVDLVFLAGYMLILGPELCRRLPILNLHPALPGGPTGTWQEVIWALLDKRASSSGVMIHRVTEVLDRGPAVSYCSYPIVGLKFDPLWKDFEDRRRAGGPVEALGEKLPLFQAVRKAGINREIPLIIETLEALSRGRFSLDPDKLIPGGTDLTSEVEKTIETGEKA